MKELPSLERANECNSLWPSIADAVDTFIRRREHADAYERIWRLIHIWEAVATTLSGAASCRLRNGGPEVAHLYLKVREHLYGVSFNKVDRRIKAVQGAFDGSNDKRIEVLRVVQKGDCLPSDFLTRLKHFLDWPDSLSVESTTPKQTQVRTAVRLATSALLDTWRRVCDVPSGYEHPDSNNVIHLISLVNTFRNRYAHVPFPYDPISSLADALEQLTESLFSIEPSPNHSVLAGGLVLGETLWRGCSTFRWREATRTESVFVFPVHKPTELWDAGPFVFLDAHKRPYVLTRLKDRELGIWEYTRYRAEANSVIGLDNEAMLNWITSPAESEYEQAEDELAETSVPDVSPGTLVQDEVQNAEQSDGEKEASTHEKPKQVVSSFTTAIEAIRAGEFEAAIPFLQRLVRERPLYHIGWLRLGFAQREMAARLRPDEREMALQQLDYSIQSFTEAIGHRDVEYKASAYYERSKSYYRRYVIGGDSKDADSAYGDAKEACVLRADSQYQSWIEYLDRLISRP